jgi:large repetitive protein
VNSTLGFLRAPVSVVVKQNVGGSAAIRWTLTRPARVRVAVETAGGVVLRQIANRRFASGAKSLVWNGKMTNGKVAPGGTFVVRVRATNELGTVTLQRDLRVRRLAAKPKTPAK